MKMIEKPARERCSAEPHTNKQGLAGDVKVEGSLGCSEYENVEFGILRGKGAE